MGVGISIGIELGIEPGIGIELELDSCSMSNRSISEFFLFVFLALLCFFCAFFFNKYDIGIILNSLGFLVFSAVDRFDFFLSGSNSIPALFSFNIISLNLSTFLFFLWPGLYRIAVDSHPISNVRH